MRWNCCFPILFCMTVSYNCLIFYTFIPYLYKTYRSHLPNLLNLPTRTYSTLPALLVSTTSIYSIEWIYRINPSRSLFIIYSFILPSIHPSMHPSMNPPIQPTHLYIFCVVSVSPFVLYMFFEHLVPNVTVISHPSWVTARVSSGIPKECSAGNRRSACGARFLESEATSPRAPARFSKWWSEAIDVVVVISPL